MSLQRCFSSLGCPEVSFDAAWGLAERHAVDAIELRSLAGTVDLAAAFAAEFGTPERLHGRLQRSSVRLVALDASLKLVGGNEPDRQQLLELGRWAEGAGVPWLRVFDGGKAMDAAELSAARETLAWWEQQRARRGWRVDLMVETHDALFTEGTLRRFVREFPRVALLWDAHHTWRKGGEDPLVTWAAIRERVVHVHIKDSIPVPSARHPFTYVMPGEGGFPWLRLRGELERTGFAGPVSLEWEKLWHPYLPSLDAALARMVEQGWW
jgi:sugar phosphate isomerase/epimerase